MQYRWVCSWPWLATPSDADAASSARPRRLRSPRVDLRKLLDRAAVAADSDSSLAGTCQNFLMVFSRGLSDEAV